VYQSISSNPMESRKINNNPPKENEVVQTTKDGKSALN